MKKMYKAMALVLCAILLVVGSVMGTLAYLQMQTGTVTNTMTIGKIEITLDEGKTDVYGVSTGERIPVTATNTDGNTYKLIPGHTYAKDPKVTVKANSEACYLFVKVVDGIAAIEEKKDADGTQAAVLTIAEQMAANGWTKMGSTDVWYKHINTVTATDTSHAVFTSFTIKGDADVARYGGATIAITAYAVQAEGFTDMNNSGTAADEAWAASGFGA